VEELVAVSFFLLSEPSLKSLDLSGVEVVFSMIILARVWKAKSMLCEFLAEVSKNIVPYCLAKN